MFFWNSFDLVCSEIAEFVLLEGMRCRCVAIILCFHVRGECDWFTHTQQTFWCVGFAAWLKHCLFFSKQSTSEALHDCIRNVHTHVHANDVYVICSLAWLLAPMDEQRILVFLTQPFRPSTPDAFLDCSFRGGRLFRHVRLNESTSRFCESVRQKFGLDGFAGMSAARAGYCFAVAICTPFRSYLHAGTLSEIPSLEKSVRNGEILKTSWIPIGFF